MFMRKPVTPSRTTEPLRRNTSQEMATCWIQAPITATVWPAA